MLSILLTLFTSYLVSVCSAQGAEGSSPVFPIIDLGYARHQPTKVNQTALYNISYATYSNIRFAQPPLGDLRFRAPQTPPPSSSEIQDGGVPLNSTDCVQTIPTYFDILPGLNGSTWGSEDCLFLDVKVPAGLKQGDKVPVLHWIYGGGFFFGSKGWGGDPAALFDDMSPDQKFIVVASNYRLGPFGWMSSESEPSMTPNAGIWDALVALEWTRDHIDLFGGDPDSVTVMGQSAGGGIIEHLLAASTSQKRPIPFTQAVLSSPGYRPHVNRSLEMTGIYQSFLDAANCSDITCLRNAPSASLAEASEHLFFDLPTQGFPGPSIGFGPVIDGNLTIDLPDRVLNNKNGHHKGTHVKRVIAGGMKNDGVASSIGEYTSWQELLSIFARSPSQSTVGSLVSLYGQFDGSASSFTDTGEVTATPWDEFSGEIIYECHAYFSAKAYSQFSSKPQGWNDWHKWKPTSSYRYDMSIPPALHGEDLTYYFFDKIVAAAGTVTSPGVAKKFQEYLRQFILGQEMDGWPEYSSAGLDNPSWMNITTDGFVPVVGQDESSLARDCEVILELMSNESDGW